MPLHIPFMGFLMVAKGAFVPFVVALLVFSKSKSVPDFRVVTPEGRMNEL